MLNAHFFNWRQAKEWKVIYLWFVTNNSICICLLYLSLKFVSNCFLVYFSGYYCGGVGLTQESGECSGGYYCPSGQSTASPTSYSCPQGSYCPIGSPQPIMCPRGKTKILLLLLMWLYSHIRTGCECMAGILFGFPFLSDLFDI